MNENKLNYNDLPSIKQGSAEKEELHFPTAEERQNDNQTISKEELIRQLSKVLETEGLPENVVREYTERQGTALLDMPEDKLRFERSLGLLVLHQQLKKRKEDPDALAVSAEKMLFLSEKPIERREAAKALVASAYEKDVVKIPSDDRRQLKSVPGQLPDMLEGLRDRVKALPETGSRAIQIFSLVVMLAAVFAVLQIFINPTVAGWFTYEGVRNVLVGIGAILTVALFFVGGFIAAALGLVGTALVFFVLDKLLPLAALGKWVVILILAVIAFVGLMSAVGQQEMLKKDVVRRRAEQLRELKKEAGRCRTYVNRLTGRVADFLREDKAELAKRDADDHKFWQEVYRVMEAYRTAALTAMREVEDSIPSA